MKAKMLCYPIILSLLTSCLPVVAASSVVVGSTIADERSSGTVVDDAVILMRIKEDLLQTEFDELLAKVSVNVHEGRVMLTGSVTEQKYSSQAVDIAWKTKGTKEVIDEIVVSPKAFKDSAKDTYIANSVRGRLLVEKELKSVNYIVEVNNSIVYLLGVAQDDDELKRALKIAGSMKGVRKVVNHVILKNDNRRLVSQNKNANN